MAAVMDIASNGPLTNSHSRDNLAMHSPLGSDSDMPDCVDNNLDKIHLLPEETPSQPLDDLSPPTPDARDTPADSIQDLWDQDAISLDSLKLMTEFIQGLRATTLDDPSLGLSIEATKCLCNPPHDQPELDKYMRLAIKLYLGNPSDKTYEINRAAVLECFPEADVPTYYRTKHIVVDLTGIESVVHHMCVNSCIAYTSPFADLKSCPICSKPWYDNLRLEASLGAKRIACQEFHTVLIGPQLQALTEIQRAQATHTIYTKRERGSSVTTETRHQLGRLVGRDGERDVPAQGLGQAQL
jgi:hypothetical protein